MESAKESGSPLLARHRDTLDVEFEGLLFCTLSRPHCQDISDHLCEADGHGEPIVVVAGVIVDFRQAHDVGEDSLHLRHLSLAAQRADEKRVGRFGADVGVELRHITIGPKVGVPIVQHQRCPAKHGIITVTEELRFPVSRSNTHTDQIGRRLGVQPDVAQLVGHAARKRTLRTAATSQIEA